MSFQLKPKRLVRTRNYSKLHEINSSKGQCMFPWAATLNDKKKKLIAKYLKSRMQKDFVSSGIFMDKWN